MVSLTWAAAVCLRLLAVYVSLLANIGVLYQILSLISSRFEKNVRDTALDAGFSNLSGKIIVFGYCP